MKHAERGRCRKSVCSINGWKREILVSRIEADTALSRKAQIFPTAVDLFFRQFLTSLLFPLLSSSLLSSHLVFLISRLRTNNALSTTTTATTPAGNTVYRQDIAFFARSIFFLLRITELISRIDWRANKRDNFGLDSVLEFIFMMEWNKLRDSHFLRHLIIPHLISWRGEGRRN